MRVTPGGLALTFLRNLNAGMQRLSELQNTLATGKRIRDPSDDPTALPSVLFLRDALAASAQYARNLNDTASLQRSGERSISDALQIAREIRALAIQAATGTTSDDDLRSIRVQVDALLDEIVALSNANVGGRYLFAGTRTQSAPFVRTGDAVTYQGNDGALVREVDAGIEMAASIPGSEAFVAGGEGIFPSIERLLAALAAADRDAIRGEISGLDRAMDLLLAAQASLGARSARVDLILDRLADLDAHLTGLLSTREDADIPKTIIELSTQENVYKSALAAGARMLQPTLLEFLR